MPSKPRPLPGSQRCARCGDRTLGQAQLCDTCKRKKTLCQDCDRPHHGPPATTKYCNVCRAKHRRKPRHPQNPPWTPAEDAKLKQIYATTNARHLGAKMREAFPGRPRHSTHRRAQLLGCSTVRKKHAPWTPEEDAILKSHGWMTPERVTHHLRQRGFKRTLVAVALRMRRTEIRAQIDGYTAQAIARLFDVDFHKASRWIKEGKLVAQRSGTTGDHHDHWHVTTEAIRDFCERYPEEIELTKIERAGSKAWFLDLITYGRIPEDGSPPPTTSAAVPKPGASPRAAAPSLPTATMGPRTVMLYDEQVTLTALAQMSGRPLAELLHRIDALGLSAEQAAFGTATPEESAAPPSGDTAVMKGIAAQVAAVMKTHRARPADLARWTALPAGVVTATLAGELPLVSPALMRMVEVLDADITITITSKRR